MAGQTPQSEQYIPVYTEGQKADLTPHLGFDPAIGSLCKHGIHSDRNGSKSGFFYRSVMHDQDRFCILNELGAGQTTSFNLVITALNLHQI